MDIILKYYLLVLILVQITFCSYRAQHIDSLIKNSDLIIRGKITRQYPFKGDETIEITIDSVLKGNISASKVYVNTSSYVKDFDFYYSFGTKGIYFLSDCKNCKYPFLYKNSVQKELGNAPFYRITFAGNSSFKISEIKNEKIIKMNQYLIILPHSTQTYLSPEGKCMRLDDFYEILNR